jgi:hypothetical protein
MSVSIEALRIGRLSVGECLGLIEQIWNNLPDQIDPQEVGDWHRAQLAKRREQAHAQPGVRSVALASARTQMMREEIIRRIRDVENRSNQGRD